MIRLLAVLLAMLAAVSLFIGDGTLAMPDWLILSQVRLPRSLLGVLVGVLLGVRVGVRVGVWVGLGVAFAVGVVCGIGASYSSTRLFPVSAT